MGETFLSENRFRAADSTISLGDFFCSIAPGPIASDPTYVCPSVDICTLSKNQWVRFLRNRADSFPGCVQLNCFLSLCVRLADFESLSTGQPRSFPELNIAMARDIDISDHQSIAFYMPTPGSFMKWNLHTLPRRRHAVHLMVALLESDETDILDRFLESGGGNREARMASARLWHLLARFSLQFGADALTRIAARCGSGGLTEQYVNGITHYFEIVSNNASLSEIGSFTPVNLRIHPKGCLIACAMTTALYAAGAGIAQVIGTGKLESAGRFTCRFTAAAQTASIGLASGNATGVLTGFALLLSSKIVDALAGQIEKRVDWLPGADSGIDFLKGKLTTFLNDTIRKHDGTLLVNQPTRSLLNTRFATEIVDAYTREILPNLNLDTERNNLVRGYVNDLRIEFASIMSMYGAER